ncbi:hypothetical protein F2P81_019045 [Scophthalmus maximus]|uniref:Uncharacterized protein n=2 Tax=Scophthalmus maximus TaxID=52904 RepID=A0A6A4SDS6_SCOMX|nr:hypothetical protein F2P81_019045 [Scophthalmus maximus]
MHPRGEPPERSDEPQTSPDSLPTKHTLCGHTNNTVQMPRFEISCRLLSDTHGQKSEQFSRNFLPEGSFPVFYHYFFQTTTLFAKFQLYEFISSSSSISGGSGTATREEATPQQSIGKMGDKELTWALKTGDLDEVKAKLVTAEDVNRTLEGGRKPLHYAADFGQTEVAEFLISQGADINAPDKHGLTPLISACFEGHISCVKFLLEKGADKDRKGPEGICAFEAAESDAIKALLK